MELLKINNDTDGRYDSFTDLKYYKGYYYVAYRTGTGHISPFGKIVIVRCEEENIRSGKSEDWIQIALIGRDGYDVRDPRLAVLNGELILMAFSLQYWRKKRSYKYASSDSFLYKFDEKTLSFPKIHTFEYKKYGTILWSMAYTHKEYYVCGYHFEGGHTISLLYKATSLNPETWEIVSQIPEDTIPIDSGINEVDIAMIDDDTMALFCRVDGEHFSRMKGRKAKKKANAELEAMREERIQKLKDEGKTPFYNDAGGTFNWLMYAESNYPFTDWKLQTHCMWLKGPRGMYVPELQKFVFIGRYIEEGNNFRKTRQINLYTYDNKVDGGKFTYVKTFAEGQDGSYAGLCLNPKNPKELFISLYSDHMRKANNERGKNDIWFTSFDLSNL